MNERRVLHHGIVGQVDGTQVPRFAGFTTFARLPRAEDVDAFDISVVGVPFDSAVTYRPGARFGPSHIRQASRLLRPYNPALDCAPFRVAQVVDAGDIACNPFNIQAALDEVESGVSEVIRGGRRPVIMGGDHSVALPVLRALSAEHGPIGLVHFDSHLDTWDTYFGEPLTHGSPFRRASEEGLIVKGNSAHVGIRGSLYDRSDLAEDADLGFTAISCRDLDRIGVDAVIDMIRERVGDAPAYISIDIDVLDPAHAPGTGTPEAGGLTSRELLEIVRGLRELRLVGADVVEVAPAYDHAEITGVAAANLIYELVTIMSLQHQAGADVTSERKTS
ncbi:agmatinase [Flexivirga oryzae]|uniref:Agmatinase n=1 Tax=Flexivirga oryzae TaxID=1794944 RepID=A0A839N5R5_9MICO|nr:agmatinase [Flexivirga oryzae]